MSEQNTNNTSFNTDSNAQETMTISAADAPTQTLSAQTNLQDVQPTQAHNFDFAQTQPQAQNYDVTANPNGMTSADAPTTAGASVGMMQHAMSSGNGGTPKGPGSTMPVMPAQPNPGQPGAQTRVHDKLSNKMLGFVIGISLACGLAAGVAGTAITNAMSHSNGYARTGVPFAAQDNDQMTSPYESESDGYYGDFDGYSGYGGRDNSEGPRGRMRQMPEDWNDSGSDSNDSNDSGNSDSDSSNSDKSGKSNNSDKSATDSTDWYSQLYQTM